MIKIEYVTNLETMPKRCDECLFANMEHQEPHIWSCGITGEYLPYKTVDKCIGKYCPLKEVK